MLDRLTWYARRLAVMEPAEIPHRVREQIRRRTARGEAGGYERVALAGARLDPLDVFEPLVTAPLDPALEADLRAAAERFQAGRFMFLGRAWPGSVLDPTGAVRADVFLLDPVTGRHWPGAGTYCFDVDFRFTNGLGDVKYAWEPNRLQFLLGPAIVARRSGDAGLARDVVATLHAWMAANPPREGVNWNSGIELGLRLVSVAVVASVLHPFLSVRDRSAIRRLVASHGRWIQLFPSLHSSANNHLVAEALGLVAAARLCPDLAEAEMWLREGRHHLEDRALALFHADGVAAEQSPAYAAFTLEMLATGFLLAGSPSVEVADRLAAAVRALGAFLDHAGAAPRIGDDDEGRVFALLGAAEPRYAASVIAAVAGLLGRPDLAPTRRDGHPRDLVFAAPSSGPDRPSGVETFGEGGYTVRRGPIAGRDVHLVFDHGPIGFGAIAAHGHADALAVWLSVEGVPVLVDAGTYLYHGEGENRRRFRVTKVHNTLVAGDVSQTEPSGAFNWMPNRARARLERRSPADRLDVTASHDGYAKSRGFVHRRSLVEELSGTVTVLDEVVGETAADLELHFLVGAGIAVRVDGGGVVLEGAFGRLRLVPPEGAVVDLQGPDAASGRGLVSPRFGVLEETVSIVFRLDPSRTIHRTLVDFSD